MSAPTFGETLRGYRVGFAYLESIDAWVRITDGAPDEGFVVEVEPTPPGRATGTIEFYVWWKIDDIKTMLTTALLLPNVQGERRLRILDDGTIVKETE